ncbi:uncharacterized protein [Rhodnius prolixus]|uniref:uncharacterized protein n=1 Tax=Rhodnius prolixus TaxID=13249 RepID=UPI003D18BE43
MTSQITFDLKKLLDDLKTEIIEEFMNVIRRELSNLNITEILKEQNQKYKQLEQENLELIDLISKQTREIERIKRRNNVVFFGIQEEEEEDYEKLEHTIVDVCTNVMSVNLDKSHINYVRRFGKNKGKKRPVVLSCVSNNCKRKLLKNSSKLIGSNIFIAEDYDKEDLLQRKKLIKEHLKFKDLGHISKLRKNGLVIDGKFMHVTKLMDRAERKQFNFTKNVTRRI